MTAKVVSLKDFGEIHPKEGERVVGLVKATDSGPGEAVVMVKSHPENGPTVTAAVGTVTDHGREVRISQCNLRTLRVTENQIREDLRSFAAGELSSPDKKA